MKFREISRDPRQILSRETCDTILSQATAGVLSVLGDGGYPYGVPINYAYCNRKIYFHGMPSGHKFDAMQRHNQVSLTVIDKDTIVPEEYTSYFRRHSFGNDCADDQYRNRNTGNNTIIHNKPPSIV